MPLYQVTVSRTVASNGIRLEPGMQVVIPTQTTTNPVSVNGGKDVIAAFQRVYGINISSIFHTLGAVLKVVKNRIIIKLKDMIFNIDSIFKGIEIGMKVVKAYNDSRATSEQERKSDTSNYQQNDNLYQGTSYHSNELTQSEKNKINRAEVVGNSRSEGRQKMIENIIEKYSLQLFNPLRYTKIYTNLDGQLRSGNGNRILQELENRIRLWHYIDAKVPICIIFYNEKKKADTTYYFTTCITPESISFRAVTERNNRELDTESTECYMVRWDNIKNITYLSVIKRTNTFAIKNDPTFSLFPSNEGYSFQCEGGSLEVPSVYFANHGSVKRALVDIKDISYNSTSQNTYYHEDQENKDLQKYGEANNFTNFSNHQGEDLDFIDIS